MLSSRYETGIVSDETMIQVFDRMQRLIYAVQSQGAFAGSVLLPFHDMNPSNNHLLSEAWARKVEPEKSTPAKTNGASKVGASPVEIEAKKTKLVKHEPSFEEEVTAVSAAKDSTTD